MLPENRVRASATRSCHEAARASSARRRHKARIFRSRTGAKLGLSLPCTATLRNMVEIECADGKRVPEPRQRGSVQLRMANSYDEVQNDWAAAMRAHDFARAWAINEDDLARRIAENAPKHQGPRHLQHIWRGEPLAGARVLVRCYHGLGDTLQFIRFAAPLRKIAREVTVWVQPELLPLVERVEGVDRALPLHDGAPHVDYDVDIEIMELAFALRATRNMIARVPYLAP